MKTTLGAIKVKSKGITGAIYKLGELTSIRHSIDSVELTVKGVCKDVLRAMKADTTGFEYFIFYSSDTDTESTTLKFKNWSGEKVSFYFNETQDDNKE